MVLPGPTSEVRDGSSVSLLTVNALVRPCPSPDGASGLTR